jgi:hypothetical protein
MNQFSKTCAVKGVSFFADKIDGEAINSGTVFIEEELDERAGRAKGFRTVEYACPDSELPKRLIHNTFPVMCEVVFELSTSKRAQKVMVVDARPVTGRQAQPAPLPKVPA